MLLDILFAWSYVNIVYIIFNQSIIMYIFEKIMKPCLLMTELIARATDCTISLLKNIFNDPQFL